MISALLPWLLCWQDGSWEGRTGHARQAVRTPGFSCHWGPLDATAGLFPEAEADEQPPGPLWPCKQGAQLASGVGRRQELGPGWEGGASGDQERDGRSWTQHPKSARAAYRLLCSLQVVSLCEPCFPGTDGEMTLGTFPDCEVGMRTGEECLASLFGFPHRALTSRQRGLALAPVLVRPGFAGTWLSQARGAVTDALSRLLKLILSPSHASWPAKRSFLCGNF